MTDSLLPFNASTFEKTLEQVNAIRLAAVPLPLSILWNPETCPAHLLPWLAWSLSIDTWDSDWLEKTKRALIAGSIALHRKKGTLAALRQVLNAVGVEFEIEEWFQTGGEPYTFQLTTSAVDNWFNPSRTLDATLYNEIRDIVDPVKPVRSHYTTRVKIDTQSELGIADAASMYTVLRARANFVIRSQSRLGLGAKASILPIIHRLITPIMTSEQSLLAPLVVAAPMRISLQTKVIGSLLLTQSSVQSQSAQLETQLCISVMMQFSSCISL